MKNKLLIFIFVLLATSFSYGKTECPKNYIAVPKMSPYTSKDFCVAKYEMKKVEDNAVSQAKSFPWTNISHKAAMAACEKIGKGYKMISNSEWQALARNIEQEKFNWAGEEIGSLEGVNSVPGMTGQVDESSRSFNGYEASEDDNNACHMLIVGCDLKTWSQNRRVHKLSTGDFIWDISSNVSEYVIGTVKLDLFSNILGSTSISNLYYPIADVKKLTAVIGGLEGDMILHFGASQDYDKTKKPPHYTMGLGSFSIYRSTRGENMVRGGGLTDSIDAGIFTVTFGFKSDDASENTIGFRCVYDP